MAIQTLCLDKQISYTGAELRPHYLLSEFNLKGSALAAFIGPCHVKTEQLVDWEDRLASDHIAAQSMVHFIGEFFGMSLREGVALQRLTTAIAVEILRRKLKSEKAVTIRRSGDDIMISGAAGGDFGIQQERKLSVSIVTASPVSVLLHLGINVDPTGAPVAAVGLGELGVSPLEFAKDMLHQVEQECQDMDWACAKVRPVV